MSGRQQLKQSHCHKFGFSLFDTVEEVPGLNADFFGRNLPFAELQRLRPSELKSLRALEDDIRGQLELDTLERTHGFGANKGVQFGYSVVSGGMAKRPLQGTVQVGAVVAERPELRRRIWSFWRQVLRRIFGKKRWWQPLLQRVGRAGRTIPGLPVSAIWLTTSSRTDRVHIDENARGVSFVCCSTGVPGGELHLQHPTTGHHTHKLGSGDVVVGRWAQSAHCNGDMSLTEKSRRWSWTLYLDYRVLASSYVVRQNKNYKK